MLRMEKLSPDGPGRFRELGALKAIVRTNCGFYSTWMQGPLQEQGSGLL